MTSKPDFKVMVLLLVFMQLTRDLFAIAKFLLCYRANRQTNKQTHAMNALLPYQILLLLLLLLLPVMGPRLKVPTITFKTKTLSPKTNTVAFKTKTKTVKIPSQEERESVSRFHISIKCILTSQTHFVHFHSDTSTK